MKKKMRQFCVILGIGIGYLVWIQVTSLSIPCLFHKITGWLCPGCGITTLFLCMFKLDFKGAFQANPFLFITGPVLIAELIYYNFMKMKGNKIPQWNNVLLVIYVVSLCIFGVWRNIL